MATVKRKLQAEIDLTRKKVDEGVVLFEQTLEKMHSTTHPTQKDKFEAELKKEVKKLQRLRDSIRKWIDQPDVKEKDVLIEDRRRIESLMERFKVIEKEMKMKAFSKQGLNRESKVDPRDLLKQEAARWIQTQLDELAVQVDRFEAEIESLRGSAGPAGGGKKGKKGSAAASSNPAAIRTRQLQHFVDRHKFHTQRLELAGRLLENDSITPEQLHEIYDGVEYYMKENQEADFEEDEGIYDELDLDEAEETYRLASEVVAAHALSSVAASAAASLAAADAKDDDMAALQSHRRRVSDINAKAAGSASSISVIASAASPVGKADRRMSDITKGDGPRVVTSSPAASSGPSPISPTMPAKPYSKALPSVAAVVAASSPVPPQLYSVTAAQSRSDSVSMADVIQDKSTQKSPERKTKKSPMVTTPSKSVAQSPVALVAPAPPLPVNASNSNDIPAPGAKSQSIAPMLESPVKSASVLTKTVKREAGSKEGGTPTLTILQRPSSQVSGKQKITEKMQAVSSPVTSPVRKPASPQSLAVETIPNMHQPEISAQPPPPPRQELAVADLLNILAEAEADVSARENATVNKLVERSMSLMPQQTDIVRPKTYVPRSPYPTASYYPQKPIQFDDRFYEQLSLDTQFFIFYYQQGSYQQYLASRELRKTWRYHKTYHTWFRRLEPPRHVIEGEYEQGSYKFFDYEGAWIQRQRSDFRFDYQAMDDWSM